MSQDEELIERLRAEARQLQSTAWSRNDGGQDCSISAALADEAADRLEALAQPVVGVEVREALSDAVTEIVALREWIDQHVPHKLIASEDWGKLHKPMVTSGVLRNARAALAASPSPVVPRLPLMSAAFRTTISGDGYRMDFKFPSIEALHAADDEWRAFRKDEQCTAGYAQSAAGSVPDTARTASITTTDAPVDRGLSDPTKRMEKILDAPFVRRDAPDAAEVAGPTTRTTIDAPVVGDEGRRIARAFEIVRQVGSMEGRTDAQTYWFGKARDLMNDHDAILSSTPATEVDMRAVVEALGFDPTNHHNAAKCPYCTPATSPADEYERGLTDAAKLVRITLSGETDIYMADLPTAIINLLQPYSAGLRYGVDTPATEVGKGQGLP